MHKDIRSAKFLHICFNFKRIIVLAYEKIRTEFEYFSITWNFDWKIDFNFLLFVSFSHFWTLFLGLGNISGKLNVLNAADWWYKTESTLEPFSPSNYLNCSMRRMSTFSTWLNLIMLSIHLRTYTQLSIIFHSFT